MPPKNTSQKTARYISGQLTQAGKGIIPIRIRDPGGFRDPLDPSGLIFNPQTAAYIAACLELLPKKLPVKLLFYCPRLSPTKKDAAARLVNTYYQSRRETILREIKSAACRVCLELFLGAGAASLSCLLSSLGRLLLWAGTLPAALAAIELWQLFKKGEEFCRINRLCRAEIAFYFDGEETAPCWHIMDERGGNN